MENKLTEKHREILHYFWNKSFPDFGHFRIRKSDRKTVPSSSVIKVWQREHIQDTFDTSGRANLERKSAWELFSWSWSLSKIVDHGGRCCRSHLTICQLTQFYTNSDVALLSTCEAVFEATRDWVWDLDLFLQVKNIGTIFRWGRGKHLVEEWRTFKLCRCSIKPFGVSFQNNIEKY